MTGLTRLMRQQVQRAQAAVRQALRATLQRLDATQPIPPAQVRGLAGEQLAVELMQHYGMASAPLQGAELVVLPIGGRSSHGVIIASVDGRYRIELQAGEVALHTDEGDHVHLKRGRVVEIVTDTLLVKASTKVRLETPVVEASQDITAGGDVTDKTRSMQGDRDIYNRHDHPGVQSGNSKTQAPEQPQ